MPDEISDTQTNFIEYCFNLIKRAKKQQPNEEWEKAEKALTTKDLADAELPFVSGYRLQYESLKSFLDQTNAEFRIVPTEAFASDEASIKQADCDNKYLSYIWREQKCQKVESQKLDSALIRNVGFTLPSFDKNKWMPYLRYIPARMVGLDPDCGGIIDNSGVMFYWEDISLEELKAKNPNLSDEELEKIEKSNEAGCCVDEDERNKLLRENPDLLASYTTARLYHLYFKGASAIRKLSDTGQPQRPNEKQAEKLESNGNPVPKRYVQIVDGIKRTLKDLDYWPFEYDDKEWELTMLRFNTPSENLYGYTDYKQMQRADVMCNNIFSDMESCAYYAGRKKFGGTPEAGGLKRTDIESFINDPKRTYEENLIDSAGNPKIREISVGNFDPALVAAYEVADKARKEASALGELLNTEIERYKDVRDIGIRINDANIHQRINRRLSGPEGYEESIAEDAAKLLEIAHQFVPKISQIEIEDDETVDDGFGNFIPTGNRIKKVVEMPWPQAVEEINSGRGILVKLGADAIVGQDLSQYWRYEQSPKLLRLQTNIQVVPGSTRSITKEQKAFMMKQFFLEVYQPFLLQIGRFDLINQFLSRIGHLAGIEGIDDLLPEDNEAQGFGQKQEQKAAEQEDLALNMQQLETLKVAADMHNKEKLDLPESEKTQGEEQ